MCWRGEEYKYSYTPQIDHKAAQDLARPKFYQHICIVIHGVQRISLCEGPSDRVLLEGRFELRADPVCKVTIDMSTISGAY